VLACQYAQARTYDDILASGVLTVALYENFPPYSYLDAEGAATGIDVDVASAVAASLGLTPQWLWISAGETVEDDMRNAIWRGHIITREKADILMRVPYDKKFSNARDGYGLARNELVVMFGPYHQERWMVLRDKNKTKDIRTMAVFQYEKLAVEIDSLPSFFLGAEYGGRLRPNLIHTASIFDGVDMLKKGEVAAVVGMQSQLLWRLDSDDARYDISHDGLSGMSVKPWDIGMAVHVENRQLAYAIEDVVDKLAQRQGLRSIFKRYNAVYLPSSLHSFN
jgi:ABC-type amino acid transport substrate-binding protein